jgi:fatty-acyl-CoA synthase
VLHTLNLRLFPEQLAFVINDAEDKVLFVDQTILPILNRIAGQIPHVEKIIVLSDGGDLPPHNLGDLLDYEALLADAGRNSRGPCWTSATPPPCATPPARPATRRA